MKLRDAAIATRAPFAWLLNEVASFVRTVLLDEARSTCKADSTGWPYGQMPDIRITCLQTNDYTLNNYCYGEAAAQNQLNTDEKE